MELKPIKSCYLDRISSNLENIGFHIFKRYILRLKKNSNYKKKKGGTKINSFYNLTKTTNFLERKYQKKKMNWERKLF